MRIVWIIKLERSRRTAAIVAVRAPAVHGVSSTKNIPKILPQLTVTVVGGGSVCRLPRTLETGGDLVHQRDPLVLVPRYR